jgi:predicted ATPase
LLEAPVLLLTATYLAPEQIMGQAIDARTDLYALGVIFYLLATGRLPFEGSDQEVMQAHLKQTPQPPRELNPAISLSLEHLILKHLAKNPNDRYPGAQQVRRISSSLIIDSPEAVWQRNQVLIGRDKELQALQSCWDKARRGKGQLAFISGEPGIGKTVLAQQAAIQSGNPLVLRGSCQELTEGSVYAPFIQILRTYLAAVRPELIDEEAQHLLRNLVRLVPEARQLWPDLADPPPLEPEQEQLRLMSSMAQFIIQATQIQPWLIILDDLQWADQASLELLHYLGSHLSTMALLIIGTYHDRLEREHRLLESLRHLSDDPTFHHFPLSGLDLEEVGRLLSQLLRQPAPLNLVEKIYQHTQGNPLYVEELSKSLIDDGHICWEEGRWQFSEVENLRLPRSIHEAIWRRIHRLSPDAQALLRQAAVLGETFKFEDLLEMSGLSKWEVLEQLDMALERHLIHETLGHTRLRFKHAEIHHILYTDMGTLRRSMLHHQAGEALERRSETPEQMAEELAYHFHEAGEFERSLVYSIQAARQAEAIYANEAALNWYNRILDILDKGHQQGTIQFEPLRVSVYEAMASVMKRSGRG